MTKINWGEAIQVDGVRPEWLRDETIVYGTPSDPKRCVGPIPPEQWKHWERTKSWEWVANIRLTADHPYYLATSKGFTYWPGGDEAPADWDGGDVLWRCGWIGNESRNDGPFDWEHGHLDGDIIGYKRTATPDVSPELVNRMVQLVRDMIAVPGDYTDEARAIAADLPDAPSDVEILRGMVATLSDRVEALERKIGRRQL